MKQEVQKTSFYSETIKEIMKKNEKFLERNIKEVLDEVSDFITKDIIDCVKFAASPQLKETYTNWAMASYIFHILQPLGYGLLVDLLASNLPTCFFGLRVLLESVIKHYYADARYPSHLFFQQKLELLNSENWKISEIMNEGDRLLKLNKNKCSSLWKEISSKWIHSKGLIDRITERIITIQNVPSWGLIIPCPYDNTDLPDLVDFKEKLFSFRRINKEAVESWKGFLRLNKNKETQ